MTSAAARTDLPALTGARGVAAWFVVLYHIRPGLSASASPDLMAFLGKGYLAVDFFFMLSGFVLWLTYGERLRTQGWRSVPTFLGRRIARIWPLHLVILAATAGFALLLDAAGKSDPAQYPWSELPLHLLLIQNWSFTDALSWNDPAWSISCEWAAYLLFPLLAFTVDRRRLPTSFLVATIIAAALALHFAMSAGGATTLGTDVPRFGLLRGIIEFAMGTILCTLWQRFRDTDPIPALASFAIAAVLFVAVISSTLPETFTVPLLFAATLLALALTADATRNPLAWPPLVFIGEISYATYLVHFLGYVAFKLVFVTDPFAVPLPLIALFLALTFGASIILHLTVELPAQRHLRRLFAAARERSPAPAL